MELAVVRRRSAGDLLSWALCGLGAGIAAGFLLSEMFGSGGPRRIGRLIRYRKAAPTTPAARAKLLSQVQAMLAEEPQLSGGGEAIEVRSRGVRGLELRGWVTSRALRTLAYRIARAGSDGLEIANHLLVRGEDDRAGAPAVGDAPRLA